MSDKQQPSSSSIPKSAFFPFPILPPLLRNYDVPAPVIHPPGSDPRSFLNPSPHRHQVLEKPASMDVDPCVLATGREIVANKVDLTASEHAGVTLSEATTMVSTTSYYPTNSAVVAQQMVNDVVVTRTESKNANFIICDVGSVDINSEKAFNKHMEGMMNLKSPQKSTVSPTINQEKPSSDANDTLDQDSEEKKKNQDLEITQKLLVSTAIKQGTPSSFANDTLDQESEKKQQDLLRKEAAEKSLFVCEIPESGCFYPNIVTVEVDESLIKNGVPNPTPVSMTPVQASNGTTQNRPTNLGVHQPMWCDICKVSCSGDRCFDQHIAGKQHQKNLKIFDKTLTPPLITVITSMGTTSVKKPVKNFKSIESENGDLDDCMTRWCEVCKVSCTGIAYQKHASGKKHRKNLQKLKKIQNLPSTVIHSVTAPPAENLKLPKGEVVNPNEGNSARCELCGVCCTSLDVLKSHISGKKHQNNLKKSEKQCMPSPDPVAKTPLSEPMTGESKVSKRKANDSLTSDEDADTKRQKMNEEKRCGVLVTCKVCNLVCDGLMAYKTHLAGFEHSAMVLKQAKGGSNGYKYETLFSA